MSQNNESGVTTGRNGKVGKNIDRPISKRSFLMQNVHNFCNYLEGTQIAKECADVKNNISKFKSYETVIAIVAQYGNAFRQDPDSTIQNFIEPLGFFKSHFSDSEWRVISAFANLIFSFVQQQLLEAMNLK
jgi:hypothetical protein